VAIAPAGTLPNAEMRDVLGVVYISKRAAVASIRAMPEATETGHLARAPFYTVKEFTATPRARLFIR
jgi:hypothetical protein